MSKTTLGTSQYTRLQRLCDIRAGSRFVGRGTALIWAAEKGHTLVIEQLIAAGAGLDVKENNGYGPIHPTATAVRYPSRQPTFLGRYTVLISAAGEGHTLVVEQLIAAGAGLDVKDNDGYEPIYPSAIAVRCPSRQPRFVGRETALIHAAAGGHTDITAALIFAGADVDVSNNAGYGQHRRGRMGAVAQALERTSPGQGDCEGRLRSRRQVGGVR